MQTEETRDLDKALADIIAIRSQLAAGTAFAGYGPAAIAATAVVALVTAAAQYFWLDDPTHHPLTFLLGWAVAALFSSTMIITEMVARSRRHHSGLADAMIHQAYEILTKDVSHIPLHQQYLVWGKRRNLDIFQRPDDEVLFYWANLK